MSLGLVPKRQVKGTNLLYYILLLRQYLFLCPVDKLPCQQGRTEKNTISLLCCAFYGK